MKTIEIDEELYRYIVAHTQYIGETASEILRRILPFAPQAQVMGKSEKTSKTPTSSVKPHPDHSIQTLNNILLSEDYALKKKVVARFMLILSALYALDTNAFSVAAESLHGHKRAYFASNQKTLLKNGTQTKPKQIPQTPYWVITNTNSERKRTILKNMMIAMQFPEAVAEKVSRAI